MSIIKLKINMTDTIIKIIVAFWFTSSMSVAVYLWIKINKRYRKSDKRSNEDIPKPIVYINGVCSIKRNKCNTMNKIDIKKELGIDSMVQELDNTIAKFKEAQCALRSLNKELEVFNKQRQSRLKRLVEWIKTKYNGR